MNPSTKEKYPVTEISLESYIHIILNDPEHRNRKTFMRGHQNNLYSEFIEVGKTYNMGKGDVRTVIYADTWGIRFYRSNEEKIFYQDTIGFSSDFLYAPFIIANQKSIGTVYFLKIVMGLIGAGFAASSFPAFILVFSTETAQSISEVKNDPIAMAIIKFFLIYIGIHTVLNSLAKTLSDKLFYHLLKKIKGNIIQDIDPEAIMKIVVTLITKIVVKKFKIRNRVIKAQNKITKRDLAFLIAKAIGQLLYEVLKVLPQSIYKTGNTLEKNARNLGLQIGHSLRKNGVDVTTEENWKLIKNFENIIVLDKLIELREATNELNLALKGVR